MWQKNQMDEWLEVYQGKCPPVHFRSDTETDFIVNSLQVIHEKSLIILLEHSLDLKLPESKIIPCHKDSTVYFLSIETKVVLAL